MAFGGVDNVKKTLNDFKNLPQTQFPVLKNSTTTNSTPGILPVSESVEEDKHEEEEEEEEKEEEGEEEEEGAESHCGNLKIVL